MMTVLPVTAATDRIVFVGRHKMNDHFDVLVIGGGPGGTPAALHLASRGKKVLLVERSGKLGGACLFVGCIPSKIIKHAADEYVSIGRVAFGGQSAPEDGRVVWRTIRAAMGRILSSRSHAALQLVNRLPTLTFVSGTARFVAKDRVEIEDNGGAKRTCTFEQTIISTGSVPTVPPFEGNGAKHVLTTEMLFAQEVLPESLVIIGGGPIGIEMAQMLTKLNVKCTVLEVLDAILKGLVEPEFGDRLAQRLSEANIAVHTSAKVQEINLPGDEFSTTFVDAQGGVKTLRSRQVLVAAGRRPNVEDLNLEAAGIEWTQRGIAVNEYLETNVKGIYAVGDVAGGPKFAHTATYEAHIAAANILQGKVRMTNLAKNSWVLFSDPEIASAGYTEAEAARYGYEVETGTYDYRIDAAAQISGNPAGLLKFVVDKRTLEIIGVHLCFNGAASVIGEGALIVSKQLTLMDVAQAIHPHPTLTEAFGTLAMTMLAGTDASAQGRPERSVAVGRVIRR
jgi:dihydrolipoamide dehydrogenase